MTAKVMLLGAPSPLMDRVAGALAPGARVRALGCPWEALAEAQKIDFDVVVVNFRDLLDKGVLFLRGLKKCRPQTEVITLSVPEDVRLSIEGMKHGAFADLLMPFDVEELAAKVAEARKKKARAVRGLAALKRKLENLAASAAFAEAADFETAVGLSRLLDEDQGDPGEKDRE